MEKKIENIVKHAEVSEKAIERYLVKVVKQLGGVCLKYSNSSEVGYPDRVALMPQGRTVWIELKSRGRRPSKVQRVRFGQMADIGHPVYVLDCKEEVDNVFKSLGYDL